MTKCYDLRKTTIFVEKNTMKEYFEELLDGLVITIDYTKIECQTEDTESEAYADWLETIETAELTVDAQIGEWMTDVMHDAKLIGKRTTNRLLKEYKEASDADIFDMLCENYKAIALAACIVYNDQISHIGDTIYITNIIFEYKDEYEYDGLLQGQHLKYKIPQLY